VGLRVLGIDPRGGLDGSQPQIDLASRLEVDGDGRQEVPFCVGSGG
jgi:hypothetical protein